MHRLLLWSISEVSFARYGAFKCESLQQTAWAGLFWLESYQYWIFEVSTDTKSYRSIFLYLRTMFNHISHHARLNILGKFAAIYVPVTAQCYWYHLLLLFQWEKNGLCMWWSYFELTYIYIPVYNLALGSHGGVMSKGFVATNRCLCRSYTPDHLTLWTVLRLCVMWSEFASTATYVSEITRMSFN